MVIERSKNAARNVFWGILNKLVRLLAQFVIRVILVKSLGEAYLGLDSLFVSVVSMLSLAELGIGTALVFNMYKAIAEDDNETICALMLFYKKCYRIIGFAVLATGLALLPFIPKLVGSDLPDGINVYLLYCINLAGVLSTYFLFAYRNCLIDAFQRSDVSSKTELFAGTLQYGLQIVLLCVLKNYYVYLSVVPCVKIFQNVLTAIIVEKKYPQFRPYGLLSADFKKQIFKKVKALVTYKIGNVVSNSVDNIVISAALGLVVLAKYGNYYYVITTLFTMIQIYCNSVTAGIGNSVVVGSVEDNYKNFKTMLLMQSFICGFCSACLLSLYQDFITLWMGADMLFDMSVVICFVAYFYSWRIQDVVNIYKDALGMWEKDRWRPLISAAESEDCIVTVGVVPTFPATGYGYIKYEISDNPVKSVISFVEKPDEKTAGKYLESGDYVWNCGVFVWKASVIMDNIKKYLPELYDGLMRIYAAVGTPEEAKTVSEVYPALPSVSIDYGVMEKAENIKVVTGEFGWNDVGSWDMMGVLHRADENRNVIVGDAVVCGTKNSTIYSSGRTIAVLGMDGVVVVETPDAVLVCPKEKAQDIKKITESLKASGRTELL